MLRNISMDEFSRVKIFASKNLSDNDLKFLKTLNVNIDRPLLREILNLKCDAFIFFNDWNRYNKIFVLLCRLKSITSICIQESVIDFNLNNKMRYADYAFIQGVDSKKYFSKCYRTEVIGNLRYNSDIRDFPGNDVLINFNLFFSKMKGKEYQWLDMVVDTLVSKDVNYKISKHPSIDINLMEKYENIIPSNASNVSSQLKDCRFLITRFSSLVHEALLLGVPVVYFDPFSELDQIGYDFNFSNSKQVIKLCKNKNELEDAVNYFTKEVNIDEEQLNIYLQSQIYTCSSSVSASGFLISLKAALRESHKNKKHLIDLIANAFIKITLILIGR